jgi:hypothetical protein
MKTIPLKPTFLALAAAGCLAPSAQAQPTLDWYTIDGGGSTLLVGDYALSGTVGQPDAAVLTAGLYSLQGGFWFAGVVPLACEPDLNQDGNVDQDDIAYLINVISGGENPTGIDPDFNQDGNADQDDITALINVIAGGACP